MKLAYSDKELFEIAKENYQTLVFHCVKLHAEGYWTKPEQLIQYTIREQLDIYLQSFLLLFAIESGHYEKKQNQFLRMIPDSNMLMIPDSRELTDELATNAERILKAPPILLQLFALRDREKHTQLSVMFVDTMLNIIIAMSYLDEQQGKGVVEYLREYANRIQAFLNGELEFLLNIDERYIFKKISSSTFKTGYVRDEMEYAHTLVNPNELKKPEGSGTEMSFKVDETVSGDIGKMSSQDSTLLQDKDNTSLQGKDSILPQGGDATSPQNKDNVSVQGKDNAFPQDKDNASLVETEEQSEQPFDTIEHALSEEEIARRTAEARLELEQARDAKRAIAVQKWMDELDSLVGLENVKEEMQSLVNLIKVRKMRENYHMPQMEMTYHMVFTGNAGTGKTTVARLVAEIYKELGVLSKGTFVETDRAGLVAGYLGQTAMKVKEVVAQAKGGVLFIDEAYALSSRDAGDDYGIEAIDTLVKEMEDNRNDLVVIVAGYRQEMERFLKSNTGLISRFNKYIDFEDYSETQLIDILKMMADKAGMEIEDGALNELQEYLGTMTEQERNDFGNARGIRNVFEKIVTNQANRIVLMDNPGVEELKQIKKEDVVL